jgi:hypothetical protein
MRCRIRLLVPGAEELLLLCGVSSSKRPSGLSCHWLTPCKVYIITVYLMLSRTWHLKSWRMWHYPREAALAFSTGTHHCIVLVSPLNVKIHVPFQSVARFLCCLFVVFNTHHVLSSELLIFLHSLLQVSSLYASYRHCMTS